MSNRVAGGCNVREQWHWHHLQMHAETGPLTGRTSEQAWRRRAASGLIIHAMQLHDDGAMATRSELLLLRAGGHNACRVTLAVSTAAWPGRTWWCVAEFWKLQVVRYTLRKFGPSQDMSQETPRDAEHGASVSRPWSLTMVQRHVIRRTAQRRMGWDGMRCAAMQVTTTTLPALASEVDNEALQGRIRNKPATSASQLPRRGSIGVG